MNPSIGVNSSRSIKSITLENCHLDKSQLQDLGLRSKTITKLDISSNQLGDCGPELAILLKGLPQLDDLKIARNRLTQRTLECFDLDLQKIRSLNLSDNIGIGQSGISALGSILSDQPALETLILRLVSSFFNRPHKLSALVGIVVLGARIS